MWWAGYDNVLIGTRILSHSSLWTGIRILIPRGLLVMDCLFLFLFSFLNLQIPGVLMPPPPSNVVSDEQSLYILYACKMTGWVGWKVVIFADCQYCIHADIVGRWIKKSQNISWRNIGVVLKAEEEKRRRTGRAELS